LSFLVSRAYLKLVRIDLCLARRGFAGLYNDVRNYQVRKAADLPATIERICTAVDVACIWYWKEVFCLQRSAATAYLLKRHGVPARMMIGARQLPFKAHAWVEVEGRVVNDKPYMREVYAVLDQC
jgi:transglutaminase superfamily protein